MKADWTETRRTFQRIAAREGVRKVAKEVPADFSTIYRMIRGETAVPSQAVRAGIERIVAEHKEPKP